MSVTEKTLLGVKPAIGNFPQDQVPIIHNISVKITEYSLARKRHKTNIQRDQKTFFNHSPILKTFPSIRFHSIWNYIDLNQQELSHRIIKRNQLTEGTTVLRANFVSINLKAIELFQLYLWIYAKRIHRFHCNLKCHSLWVENFQWIKNYPSTKHHWKL